MAGQQQCVCVFKRAHLGVDSGGGCLRLVAAAVFDSSGSAPRGGAVKSCSSCGVVLRSNSASKLSSLLCRSSPKSCCLGMVFARGYPHLANRARWALFV